MMNLKLATTLLLLVQLIQFSGCGKLEELTSGSDTTSTPASGERTTSNTPINFDKNTSNNCTAIDGSYRVLKINGKYRDYLPSSSFNLVDEFEGDYFSSLIIYDNCEIVLSGENRGSIQLANDNSTATINIIEEPIDDHHGNFRKGKYSCSIAFSNSNSVVDFTCDNANFTLMEKDAYKIFSDSFWENYNENQVIDSDNFKLNDINIHPGDKAVFLQPSTDTSGSLRLYNEKQNNLFKVDMSGIVSEVTFMIDDTKNNNSTSPTFLPVNEIKYYKEEKLLIVRVGKHTLFKNLQTDFTFEFSRKSFHDYSLNDDIQIYQGYAYLISNGYDGLLPEIIKINLSTGKTETIYQNSTNQKTKNSLDTISFSSTGKFVNYLNQNAQDWAIVYNDHYETGFRSLFSENNLIVKASDNTSDYFLFENEDFSNAYYCANSRLDQNTIVNSQNELFTMKFDYSDSSMAINKNLLSYDPLTNTCLTKEVISTTTLPSNNIFKIPVHDLDAPSTTNRTILGDNFFIKTIENQVTHEIELTTTLNDFSDLYTEWEMFTGNEEYIPYPSTNERRYNIPKIISNHVFYMKNQNIYIQEIAENTTPTLFYSGVVISQFFPINENLILVRDNGILKIVNSSNITESTISEIDSYKVFYPLN